MPSTPGFNGIQWFPLSREKATPPGCSTAILNVGLALGKMTCCSGHEYWYAAGPCGSLGLPHANEKSPRFVARSVRAVSVRQVVPPSGEERIVPVPASVMKISFGSRGFTDMERGSAGPTTVVHDEMRPDGPM